MIDKEYLKSKIGIRDVIEDDVQEFRRVNNGFKCKCPKHNDKNPSMFVNPNANLFYCYTCKEGGDIFSYLKFKRGMEFPTAIRYLQERFNIQPKERPQKNLEALLAETASFYEASISPLAKGFLRRRAVNEDTAKAMQLGSNPEGDSYSLTNHLVKKGFGKDTMLESGLVKMGDNGRLYDHLRNRLVFPIKDGSGRVVSFVGRTLGTSPKDMEHKYLNTCLTRMFHKKEALINVHSLNNQAPVTVVEGPLDVAAIIQSGDNHVVGIMQACVTVEQARILSGKTECVRLCLDADFGGSSGISKSIKNLLGQGLLVDVTTLPSGYDPDQLIREKGAAAFRKALAQSVDWYDYVTAKHENANDPRSRLSLAREMSGYITEIQAPILKELYWNHLAADLGIPKSVLRSEMKDDSHQVSKEQLLIDLCEMPKHLLPDQEFDTLVSITEKEFGLGMVPFVFSSETELDRRLRYAPDEQHNYLRATFEVYQPIAAHQVTR